MPSSSFESTNDPVLARQGGQETNCRGKKAEEKGGKRSKEEEEKEPIKKQKEDEKKEKVHKNGECTSSPDRRAHKIPQPLQRRML